MLKNISNKNLISSSIFFSGSTFLFYNLSKKTKYEKIDSLKLNEVVTQTEIKMCDAATEYDSSINEYLNLGNQYNFSNRINELIN